MSTEIMSYSGGRHQGARRRSGPTCGLTPPSIALIERDQGFLAVVRKRVEQAGWSYEVLPRRVPARKVAAMAPDVLVVDFALLEPRPLRWLRQVCREAPRTGVVVCTAEANVANRVTALRLGADDWLGKPCHAEELVARLEALLRRLGSPVASRAQQASAGEIELRGRYQVAVAGSAVRLTRRESELLRLLINANDTILERGVIYERIWGHMMSRDDRSVDVFVHKLRAKLEVASPRWRYIHTHRGFGYRFKAEPVGPHPAQPQVCDSHADVPDPRFDEQRIPLAA